MNYFSSLSQKHVHGKTVLLRVDLNVLDEDIKFSLRVIRAVETIRLMRRLGLRVVVISHRGRPRALSQGMQNTKQNRVFSLQPFIKVFCHFLNERVVFIDDIATGIDTIRMSTAQILICENLRFWDGEEKNSRTFARQLARLGDIYVNDAFAVSHRAHASVVAVTHYLPSFIGPALEQEIRALERASRPVMHPFVAILGGAKVIDKIPLLRWFRERADYILTGGGVANTFLKWCGFAIEQSLSEDTSSIQPFVANPSFIIPRDTVMFQHKIFDIGHRTADMYASYITRAHTVVWNGPVGNTDLSRFRRGSRVIWNALQKRAYKDKKFYAFIGGGETTSFILREVKGNISRVPRSVFLSTGGGAMLQFLIGKKLPGLAALEYYALQYEHTEKKKTKIS